MKLFRDLYPSILFVIGFALTLFISASEMVLMNSWLEEKTSLQESTYVYERKLAIVTEYSQEEADLVTDRNSYEAYEKKYYDMAGQLLAHLKTKSGNVCVNSICASIGAGMVSEQVGIVVSYNEPLARKLQSGKYPESLKKEKAIAFVGDDFQGYIEKNGKEAFLRVGLDTFPVYGIYENYSAIEEDNGAYLFYDGLGDTLQNAIKQNISGDLKGGRILITFGSNSEPVEQEVKNFIKYCEEQGMTVQEGALNINQTEKEFYRKAKAGIDILTFVLSLVNCMCLSTLWVKRKRNELVICTAFGMSFGKLMVRILKEVLLLISIAFLIAMAAFAVNQHILGARVVFGGSLAWNFCFSAGVMFIVILTAMVPSFLYCMKIKPAAGLREL